MKIFFGGIIQGSNKGSDVHGQDYRHEIRLLIRQYYSDIWIFDPVEGHESSIDYDDDMAKQTFYKNLSELHSSDLVIAYLPRWEPPLKCGKLTIAAFQLLASRL
jgi:hypothetical protein